jgi:CRP-like cAMP-binding protein
VEEGKPVSTENEVVSRMAALSAAFVPIFRGRFCDILLPNRAIRTFDEDQVLYELGDRERTFFFVRHGVVKVGTITDDGREIIYDIRKSGDVVGELCAIEPVRRDRAVVVERTEAIAIPFDEVVEVLAKHPTLLRDLVQMFGGALAEAYDQVNRLAVDDVVYRSRDVGRAFPRSRRPDFFLRRRKAPSTDGVALCRGQPAVGPATAM